MAIEHKVIKTLLYKLIQTGERKELMNFLSKTDKNYNHYNTNDKTLFLFELRSVIHEVITESNPKEHNVKFNFHKVLLWLNKKYLKLLSNRIFTEKDFEDYLFCEQIRYSENENDIIFIIKSIIDKIKYKKEFVFWAKNELKKEIKQNKERTEITENLNGHDLFIEIIEKENYLFEFALNYLNDEIFINSIQSTPEKENKFVKLWSEYNTKNLFLNYQNKNEFSKTLNYYNTSNENNNLNPQNLGDAIIVNNNIKTEKANPHPRIFKERIHFDLFKHLQTTVKNKLADYSFIFRRMQEDGYIFESIKESEFRLWLNEVYQIPLDKLKLLDYCKTAPKESIYTTAKHIYKLH